MEEHLKILEKEFQILQDYLLESIKKQGHWEQESHREQESHQVNQKSHREQKSHQVNQKSQKGKQVNHRGKNKFKYDL